MDTKMDTSRQTARPGRRLGFTAYELLAIVAIIAILIALLLPAIQQARAAARQSQSGNNLRFILLAMHNYHDTHTVFPPGIIAGSDYDNGYVAKGDGCNNAHRAGANAFTYILPFVEQEALYAAYNFDHASCAVSNMTAVGAVIETYVNPANPRGGERLRKGYYPGDVGPLDYGLNLGNNAIISPAVTVPDGVPAAYAPGRGLFNVNSRVGIRDVVDGTSNTLAVGDNAGGPQLSHGLPELGGGPPREGELGKGVDQPWAQDYIGTTGGLGGYGSVFATTAFDAWYDNGSLMPAANNVKAWTPQPPNMGGLRAVRGTTYPEPHMALDMQPGADGRPPAMLNVSVGGFRAFHAGGVNMGFADGSVRFVSENIDHQTWASAATIAGGEVIGAF